MNAVETANRLAESHLPQAPQFQSARGGRAHRSDGKAASDIRDLFAAIGSEYSLREYMVHVSETLVGFFGAESCTIHLLGQEDIATPSLVAGRAVPASRSLCATAPPLGAALEKDGPIESEALVVGDPEATATHGVTLRSEIKAGAVALGAVVVVCPRGESSLEGENLDLLDAITLHLGQVLYARRLRDLLDSRLLLLAFNGDPERSEHPIRIGSVPALDKMTRIVAKSFYREMARAGFGSHQIIRAATEIISELQSHLRRRCAEGADA